MSSKSDLKYIPGLDALRGFACLSVIIFHSNIVTKIISPYMPFTGGALGVDLFFVLSGYLITSILLNQFAKESTISFKNFYIKRILRLYPPILISVIVFLIPLLFTAARPDALSNIISLVTYTGDVAMLMQHFTHLPYPLLSSHSWSLAVEEQFYLTFPLLLFWLLRYVSRKKQTDLIALFPVFIVLYFLVVLGSSIALGKWFYKFFFWRFFEIYLGSFIAVIYSASFQRIAANTPRSERIKNITHKIYRNRIVLLLSAVYVLAMLIYPSRVPFQNYIALYNFHYVLFTIAGSVLIVNLAYPYHPRFVKLVSNKILVFLGKISYGLYLYTPFILQIVDSMLGHGKPYQNVTTMLTIDLVTIAGGLVFSYLSYTLIEKNILKLKSRLEPKATEEKMVLTGKPARLPD